ADETAYAPPLASATLKQQATRKNGGAPGFIDELRRRKVPRVGAVYAVVAWLIMQVAEVTFAPLGIPPWGQTLVIVLLLIGFPAALVMAWTLEMTPQGLVVDADGVQGTGAPGRPIDYLLVGVVLLAFSALAWHIMTRDESTPATVASADPALSGAGAPANSIAVMPFVSIGKDVQNAYFADGLADELLGLLGKLDELQVAARTSSFYFRNKDVGLPEISKRLGVRHILEGTVRRDGNDVRVRAELVDTSSGFNVWSATYDRKLEDIFVIQNDIATAVVDELKLVLSVESEAKLAARPTDDVRAYDLYLRAQGLRRGAGNTETLDEALDVYTQALAIDPAFAAAHAGVCLAYLDKYERSAAVSNFEAAERACQQALEYKGSAAEVHTALGRLYLTSGEYEKAQQEFGNAIDLDPRSVDAFRGLAESLNALNRFDEAEEAFRRAIALEPGYWAAYESLASFLFFRGRFAEAVDGYRRLTTLLPEYADGFNALGAAYHFQGDFKAAAAAYKHSLELQPTREAYSNMGTMYFYLGDLDAAADMYREAVELAPEDHRLWGNLADAYNAAEGRESEALDAYRTAIRLAEAQLEVNPANVATLSPLAHYYANIGEADRARELIQQALALAPGDIYVRYDEALVYARLGETERALSAIEKAVGAGYLPSLLPFDPGLRALAGEERFQRLHESGGRK
ncbi:MAG: tetratricopeptide repeat protein, partial [Gammaproteobacteria bacterium]